MARMLWITVSLIFVGCTSRISKDDIVHLNGYWEIEKVTFPNGKTKEFKASTSIDYIQIDSLSKGFRKKMQPKFNGTYETSDDAVLFMIIEENDGFIFLYSDGKNKWKEEIVKISESHFSVRNSDTLQYTYKRFQPINITE